MEASADRQSHLYLVAAGDRVVQRNGAMARSSALRPPLPAVCPDRDKPPSSSPCVSPSCSGAPNNTRYQLCRSPTVDMTAPAAAGQPELGAHSSRVCVSLPGALPHAVVPAGAAVKVPAHPLLFSRPSGAVSQPACSEVPTGEAIVKPSGCPHKIRPIQLQAPIVGSCRDQAGAAGRCNSALQQPTGTRVTAAGSCPDAGGAKGLAPGARRKAGAGRCP